MIRLYLTFYKDCFEELCELKSCVKGSLLSIYCFCSTYHLFLYRLKTMSGHTGIYLKILIVISSLTSAGQLIFQIVLIAMPPYAQIFKRAIRCWKKF
ncbi:hypothetical protein NQ315_003653 [Exocentrus adspersus]|uniref:Piezo TM1-24 domain-containing protein n=1 Tax=Exocentrus adspersus TaxID=1586481 RepID=A0AAV8VC95_9CUCU|nr:hypothetical protein NQ315_003653 [Exocentrus adspersus]